MRSLTYASATAAMMEVQVLHSEQVNMVFEVSCVL